MNFPRLSVDLLQPVAGALCGPGGLPQPGWRLRQIGHTPRNPVTGGLYRVSGQAVNGRASEPAGFTAVLKVLRFPKDAPAWLRANEPSHWNYWRREALAYRGGLLASIGGSGLCVPRFLAAHEPDEDTVWLWLEHVDGVPATAWPPERYLTAARDLATTQAPYLAGRPLPESSWLRHDWLDAWAPTLPSASLNVLEDDAAWAHPLIRQALPREAANATRRLAAGRDEFLRVTARLPATICHHDFWPPNLMSCAGSQTVALDWSWVGIGPAGLDAANLVLDATSSGYLPSNRLAELDGEVLDAYLAGLTEVGWRDTTAQIQLGHDVTAALRFGLDVPELLMLARNPARHAPLEKRHGRPIEQIVANRAAVTLYALSLADRARPLITSTCRGRRGDPGRGDGRGRAG